MFLNKKFYYLPLCPLTTTPAREDDSWAYGNKNEIILS